MALNELKYEFKVDNPVSISEWVHLGVVGSGDLEVLIEKKDFNGAVECKVITPVDGFKDIWEKVLGKFVFDNNLGDILIRINDNNATPVVVSMRLRQALNEALKEMEVKKNA